MRDSIAHFKIISKIGAGGMGEVYLADDTKLDRKVAIKFLPPEYSDHPERLSRFVQEAKAASALNHPNIITVHEIGEHDGTHFIASEYIEGRTLRERIASGRISFDEIMSIAIQTVEALSAAHRVGIVHRDIKPENVMIRPDGYVKVLDFGLAKLNADGQDVSPDEQTRKLVNSTPGTVMGTAAYMSPEQARGQKIDERSDVFSFGVLLYEVLSGQAPFRGETMMDVISSVMTADPQPLGQLAPHLPKELLRIVQKSLRKKREQRYQTTRDLLIDLKDLRDELQLEAKLEQTAVPSKDDIQTDGIPSRSTNSGSALKDSVLLTEFENVTGDGIFDQTLKMALSFSLAQSPFLDIIPENKVRETLRMMGRSPDERVTKALGAEICLRLNLKAFITGTISSFGSIFVLTLEAINARTNEVIGREFEQVDSREEVLTALGRSAKGLREKLGESLSSIERFNLMGDFVATTSSLEALKLFSLARGQQARGKNLEAIPFFERALEIDPKFVSAYLGVAVIYYNTNQAKLAADMITKAYELRETVSENERLRTMYFYYKLVTGEVEKAIDTLELWRNTFPTEVVPIASLTDTLEIIGQSERAVEIAREGLRLDPGNAVLYSNLAESLLSLNRFDEVRETCDQAFRKNLDSDQFHISLFQVAFIENHDEALASNVKWFSGTTVEFEGLRLEAGRAGFQGRWRASQDFSRRAIDLASRSNAAEVAALYMVEQALRITFWSGGSGLPSPEDAQLRSVLRSQLNKALSLQRGQNVMVRAALAFAVGGQLAEANSIVNELRVDRPKDTLVNELWLPTVDAALVLQKGNAKEAVEELEVTERYEKAGEFYPQYLRGLAYTRLDKAKEAERQFDRILDHRGQAPLSSIYPLAQLAKARLSKRKADYDKFFEFWSGADKDMPALVEAKEERATISQ